MRYEEKFGFNKISFIFATIWLHIYLLKLNNMKDVIEKKHQFEHDINKVWHAITDAKQISTWFLKADFKPEAGYKYIFTHEGENEGDCTNITGEVLRAKAVTELVYTWIVQGTEVVTTVSWQLEENEQGTLLTLVHSGISKYPGDTAVKMFESFSGGWANCIESLTKFLSPVNA